MRNGAEFLLSSLIVFSAPTMISLVEGDPFLLPQPVHDEIAAVYADSRLGLIQDDRERPRALRRGVMTIFPRIVFVDEGKCHPPSGCSCWIIWDPAHISKVERDKGGWRKPQAGLLSAHFPQTNFALAHIQRLDADAYSAIGCIADWRALKPLSQSLREARRMLPLRLL